MCKKPSARPPEEPLLPIEPAENPPGPVPFHAGFTFPFLRNATWLASPKAARQHQEILPYCGFLPLARYFGPHTRLQNPSTVEVAEMPTSGMVAPGRHTSAQDPKGKLNVQIRPRRKKTRCRAPPKEFCPRPTPLFSFHQIQQSQQSQLPDKCSSCSPAPSSPPP